MTFEETTEFLYKQVPVFQHNGASAYKPGLDNTNALDAYFDYPHKSYKTIHVGGTNGKGSTSHTLAAILQAQGYNVGLYTSPHLVDFRERIRVNGEMLPEQYVIDFVAEHFDSVKHVRPSFFELTMMMAFCYFRACNVDIAVIEVGLGGRLDSTNVITPEMSIITNISFDHVQFLGDTLEKIAEEKAGIIKPAIPVVIGEAEGGIKDIFRNRASEVNAPVIFAQETGIIKSERKENNNWIFDTEKYASLRFDLGGECQQKNALTILTAIEVLNRQGISINERSVREGFGNVCALTGLQGRWQQVNDNPLTFCDTGHNKAGIEYIVEQLKQQQYETLRIVIGMVNDKDVSGVLEILPKEAVYYFTKASVPRALSETELAEKAACAGLIGTNHASVKEAYQSALAESDSSDFIFVGGSNFIVADLLASIR